MRKQAAVLAVLIVTGVFARSAAGAQRPAVAPDSCPVTLSPVRPFTPPVPYPALPPSADRFWYGSEALWVMPRVDGTWRGLRTDHGFRDKLFVWRVGFDGRKEQKPKLAVTAKRIDGDAPVFTRSTATNAYHPSFGWAMLTGVEIPNAGCWKLSLQYREDTLSFVVWAMDPGAAEQ